MKTLALGLAAAVATLLAVSSFAASQQEPLERADKTCEDCGKQGESCKGSVRCCEGLICQSSSGGDPTCVER